MSAIVLLRFFVGDGLRESLVGLLATVFLFLSLFRGLSETDVFDFLGLGLDDCFSSYIAAD